MRFIGGKYFFGASLGGTGVHIRYVICGDISTYYGLRSSIEERFFVEEMVEGASPFGDPSK